jgi:chromosome partitioning protein
MITSIINRKGGVGKTGTAHALGAGLMKKGHKVLFIDLDSQANLTYAIGADSSNLSTVDILTGEAAAQEAIQHTKQGDIIAGSEALAGADAFLTDTGKEYRLKEALQPLLEEYDYIIIDTPAALNVLTVNALTASTNGIIPVQADLFSLQGIGLLYKAIDRIKKYCNHDFYIDGILLTRYNGRAIISQDMRDNLEEMARQLQTKLYKTPIRECIAFKEAQAQQTDIFSYAPRSNAAADYMALVEEYLQ